MSDIGRGLCLGIGGSNARVGLCENGHVVSFEIEKTPSDSGEFFRWMADEIVKSTAKGARWAVIGVPGMVKTKNGSHFVGPLVNVAGLADGQHNLEQELIAAKPEIQGFIQDGFIITCVNDGLLAAYAAQHLLEHQQKNNFDAIASFIIGTGVGGAVIRRVPETDVFRPSDSLFEIGHVPLSHDYEKTFETTISGTGLLNRHNHPPEEMDETHEAWREVGMYMGQLIMMMSLIAGVDAVVACGGVGGNNYAKYEGYLNDYLNRFNESPNGMHRRTIPYVTSVNPDDSQEFEIIGAEGVMRYVTHKNLAHSTNA